MPGIPISAKDNPLSLKKYKHPGNCNFLPEGNLILRAKSYFHHKRGQEKMQVPGISAGFNFLLTNRGIFVIIII